MLPRIKISDNFFLDEYVTREFYMRWEEKCIWWIRPEVIKIDQFLRNRFGLPITINNWWDNGNIEQRGLRYPFTKTGAGDSMHKFGCASDKVFETAREEFYAEVRHDIVKNFKQLYQPLGLTTIETNTDGWLHTDCRHIPNQDEINIVYP
jgi:hypothetical protein